MNVTEESKRYYTVIREQKLTRRVELARAPVAGVAAGVSDGLPGPCPHPNTQAKMNKIPCQIGE